MFRSITNDIRHQFQSGNTITRLIIVNVAVFLAIILFKLVLTVGTGFNPPPGLFKEVTTYLFLSDDLLWNATHPWAIVTHMFTHIGVFHLIFNMLVLYWFGRIAGDLLGDHRMLPLYIYSGLAGALIYLLTEPLIYAGGSNLHGASAAIFGIVAAAGITAPDYQMRLLFLGDVRLKYIVAGLLVVYVIIGIADMENVGGQMAHLGGAAFGFFYVHMLRQGRDLTLGFRRLMSLFKKRAHTPSKSVKRKVTMEVRHRAANQKSEIQTPIQRSEYGEQERLDAILDQIKQSGYENLSEEDKKFLHDASQK
jgi:membrane associated rhomboid family serine protease